MATLLPDDRLDSERRYNNANNAFPLVLFCFVFVAAGAGCAALVPGPRGVVIARCVIKVARRTVSSVPLPGEKSGRCYINCPRYGNRMTGGFPGRILSILFDELNYLLNLD